MPKQQLKKKTSWDDVPLYMDLPFLSRLFGFSLDCLKKKAQAGVLPAAKICNEWRISKEDAQKYYEESKKLKKGE